MILNTDLNNNAVVPSNDQILKGHVFDDSSFDAPLFNEDPKNDDIIPGSFTRDKNSLNDSEGATLPDDDSSVTVPDDSSQGSLSTSNNEPVDSYSSDSSNPYTGLFDNILSWDDLMSKLDELSGTILNGWNGDMWDKTQKLADVLASIQKYIDDRFRETTPDEATQIAEYIYNLIYNFTTQQYQNEYNRQNWYLECSYNSPIAAMQRAMDAGLNPIWYYQSLGNSNGSTIQGSSNANSSQITSPYFSEAVDKANAYNSAGTNLTSAILQAGKQDSEIAQTNATAMYNTELANTERQLRPDRLGELRANQAAAYAEADKRRSDKYMQDMLNDNYQDNKEVYAAMPELQRAYLDAQYYALVSQVQQGWETLNLGYDRLQADLNINAQNVALGYAQLNTTAFDQAIQSARQEVENMKYMETDTLTGESREVSGSMSVSTGVDGGILPLDTQFTGQYGTKDNVSFTRGNKTYTRTVNKDVKFDGNRASQYIGGYLRFMHDLQNGNVKLSPSRVSTIESNMAHYYSHLYNTADKIRMHKWSQYVSDSLLKRQNGYTGTGVSR